MRVIDSRRGGLRALACLTTSEGNVFVPQTVSAQLSLCKNLQAGGDDGVCLVVVQLLEALKHFFAGELQGLDIWLNLVSLIG
jgi:hypothetical protein